MFESIKQNHKDDIYYILSIFLIFIIFISIIIPLEHYKVLQYYSNISILQQSNIFELEKEILILHFKVWCWIILCYYFIINKIIKAKLNII